MLSLVAVIVLVRASVRAVLATPPCESLLAPLACDSSAGSNARSFTALLRTVVGLAAVGDREHDRYSTPGTRGRFRETHCVISGP